MRYLINEADEILKSVYLDLVNNAQKHQIIGNIIRCCDCGRCDKTLKKIDKGVYACTDCITKRYGNEQIRRIMEARKK